VVILRSLPCKIQHGVFVDEDPHDRPILSVDEHPGVRHPEPRRESGDSNL
jgi:hypothetical protein